MRSSLGIQILLAVRDGHASTFTQLAKHLSVFWSEAPLNALFDAIRNLSNARLLEFVDSDPGDWATFRSTLRKGGDVSVSVTATLHPLQSALGLSLNELSGYLTESTYGVRPLFGHPNADVAVDVFVAMPFDDQYTSVYKDHILPLCRRLELQCLRGDDFFESNQIVQDIWNAICGSKVVIADCSGRNPNVFYEIGLAHAVGVPVILTTQGTEDIPFDVAHLRHIRYERSPEALRAFESVLEQNIGAVLRERPINSKLRYFKSNA